MFGSGWRGKTGAVGLGLYGLLKMIGVEIPENILDGAGAIVGGLAAFGIRAAQGGK